MQAKPLKFLVSCNDEVLSEKTEPDYEFDYIEIGSVEYGKGITSTERMTYGKAPSRARRIVKKGDVIISTVRTYLKAVAYINERHDGQVASTGFAVLRPKNIHDKFLYYSVLSEDFIQKVEANSVGISYPAITATKLMTFKIPTLPLCKQQIIANYLDDRCSKIDAIIAEAKASIEEYKELKQAVIYEAVTKGLDKNVEMKDSGIEWIGKIPKSWEYVSLKRIYDYSDGAAVRVGPFGSALPSNKFTDEGIWVYTQRTVLDNNFTTNDTFINESLADELSSFAVKGNDILITTRGSVGKIAIVPTGSPKGILHPCLIRFRVDLKKYNIELLKFMFNESDFMMNQILRMSNSTIIDVLYSYNLKELKIPLIPLSEQNRIVQNLTKRCNMLDDIMREKQSLIDNLESYKKSLIYEVVTGKQKVVE